jgi:Photosynthetic reaction centre cytochrome C subunit
MRTRVIAALALLLASCQAYRTQKRLSSDIRIDMATLRPITAPSSEADPPAEKRFHNIEVLRGLPASQLYPVMAMFANSLGVTCAHCHGEYFEEETRNEKQIARQMVQLTRAINAAQFQGEPTVTCFTCHRGRDYPLSAPDVAQAGWQKLIATPPPPATPLPDAASVLSRYESVLPAGGAVTSGKGDITIVGGLDERKNGTFTLAGGKLTSTVQVPPPVERALARWSFGAIDVAKTYDDTSVRLQRDQSIVVAASSNDDAPDHLTFDASTGYLTRAQTGLMTELGYVPEEIRFSDYRPVAGVPTPHLVEWARGDYLVTLRFSEVAR